MGTTKRGALDCIGYPVLGTETKSLFLDPVASFMSDLRMLAFSEKMDKCRPDEGVSWAGYRMGATWNSLCTLNILCILA